MEIFGNTLVLCLLPSAALALVLLWLKDKIKASERWIALQKLCALSPKDIKGYHDSYENVLSDRDMVSDLNDYLSGEAPARFKVSSDRQEEYIVDCYQVLNMLCALGNVKKMYIPKCIDASKSLAFNQKLQEKQVSEFLKLPKDKATTTIMEVGCGCGRIAHHMAQLTGATVVGVNIDEVQLKDAREFAKNVPEKLVFLKANYNERLPFDDETFDGIYGLGAYTAFISDYQLALGELFRVLKPGGRVVLADAVLLDKFDKSREEHMHMLAKSRMVMAGGCFLHHKYYESLAKAVGFEVAHSGCEHPPVCPPELQTLENEHALFAKIKMGVDVLTAVGVLPKHMSGLMLRLREGGDELVQMEKQKLLTMDWDFTFYKPIE